MPCRTWQGSHTGKVEKISTSDVGGSANGSQSNQLNHHDCTRIIHRNRFTNSNYWHICKSLQQGDIHCIVKPGTDDETHKTTATTGFISGERTRGRTLHVRSCLYVSRRFAFPWTIILLHRSCRCSFTCQWPLQGYQRKRRKEGHPRL